MAKLYFGNIEIGEDLVYDLGDFSDKFEADPDLEYVSSLNEDIYLTNDQVEKISKSAFVMFNISSDIIYVPINYKTDNGIYFSRSNGSDYRVIDVEIDLDTNKLDILLFDCIISDTHIGNISRDGIDMKVLLNIDGSYGVEYDTIENPNLENELPIAPCSNLMIISEGIKTLLSNDDISLSAENCDVVAISDDTLFVAFGGTDIQFSIEFTDNR